MKKNYLVILFTLLIIFTILIISNHNIETIFKAKVCYIEETNLISSIISKGIIEEVEKEEIFTDLPLYALSVNIKEGDKVNRGQTLVEFDLSDMELELEKAQINAQMEEVLLNRIKNEKSNVNIDNELYNVDSQFYSEKIIPKDKMNEGLEIQRKNLEIAEVKLNDIKRKIQKQNKYIKSPINGIITDLNIKKGNYTEIGKPVIVISNLNKLQVRLKVDENYISQITVGQEVEISPKALDKKYHGHVNYVAPVAINSGNEVVVEVLVEIDNPDDNLKPGYSVEAKIITETKTGVFTIPYEAILQDELGEDYVYVIDKNIAKKQYIETGSEMDFEAEIKKGLNNKDLLIINPKESLGNKTVKIEKIQKGD